MPLGSLRHSVVIGVPAERVWALAGDPARLHEWFPGVTGCEVVGTSRTIHLASGLSLPEEILVHDDAQRRFQYRITAPMFNYHRSTLDIVAIDANSCLAMYSIDCDPRTMALIIAGGAADALLELKAVMEQP